MATERDDSETQAITDSDVPPRTTDLPAPLPFDGDAANRPPGQPRRHRDALRAWLDANAFFPTWLPAPLRRRAAAYTLGGFLAIGMLAGVLGLVQLVPSFDFPESLLLLAIVVVALLWGSAPGLLASVLIAVLTAAITFPPASPFALRHQEDPAGVALLLVLGCIISLMAGQNERARRAAVEANERMDQFLHLVSHELRNPLTSIKASAQLAVRQTQAQAEARKSTLSICNGQMPCSCARASKLIA